MKIKTTGGGPFLDFRKLDRIGKVKRENQKPEDNREKGITRKSKREKTSTPSKRKRPTRDEIG